MPQAQVLLLALLWVLPLRPRTISYVLLLSHAILAMCTLDVWVVALAVRAADMERYSRDASQSTCVDSGFDTGDAVSVQLTARRVGRCHEGVEYRAGRRGCS